MGVFLKWLMRGGRRNRKKEFRGGVYTPRLRTIFWKFRPQIVEKISASQRMNPFYLLGGLR